MGSISSLEKVILGGAGAAALAASRYFIPNEVAEFLGSHEMRAYVEHFLYHFSIPYFVAGAYEAVMLLSEKDKNQDTPEPKEIALFTTCSLLFIDNIIWEPIQATERGYYQWDQVAANFLGSITCLSRVYYREIIDYAKKLSTTFRDNLKNTFTKSKTHY